MEGPPSASRKKLRVTTGCKTCRARRVKCDEAKPICRNCAKRNRLCNYECGATRQNVPVPRSDDRAERTSHRSSFHIEADTSSFQIDDFSNIGPSPSEHSRVTTVDSSPGQEDSVTAHGVLDDGVENTSPPGQGLTPADLASIFLDGGQISFHEPATQHHSPGNNFDLESNTQAEPGPGSPCPEPLAIPPSTLHTPERIPLTAAEVSIFRNYVETVSRWIDSFSRDQPFYSVVPIMALQCPVLMQSCLALSSKQLALKASGEEGHIRESLAISYYRKAIKSISSLLTNPECAQSDEILASSIILSTYEMFDVVGDSFGSHLKGIAYFLQSQRVTGDASGIKGTAYWTWYRHEIWAALQIGRRMFLSESYWEPESLDSFDGLCVEDIANRAIFLFGQCVSFCNNDETSRGGSLDERHQAQGRRAMVLDTALENWKRKLPSSMSHFFAEPPASPDKPHEFPFIWFIYPQSAIGYQVYHASKILLKLQSPSILPGYCEPGRMRALSDRRQIERSREQIFLISNAGVPDTWSLISTECLFVAGLVTEGVLEREQTLKLIENCQKNSGRRTLCLADELRKLWSQ